MIISGLILLFGMFFSGGDVGAGVYNDDKVQLGEGIQSLTMVLGIFTVFFIIGMAFNKIGDDRRFEELLKELKTHNKHPDKK